MAPAPTDYNSKEFGELYFQFRKYCELENWLPLPLNKSNPLVMTKVSKTNEKRRLYIEALKRYEKQLLEKTKTKK